MRTIRAEQVKNLFAGNIRKLLLEAPRDYERIYEIRLRVGRPVFLCYDSGEKFLRTKDVPYLVTRQDLKETLEYISGYSLYACEDELRQGYISVQGGHRVGVTGKVILDRGNIRSIKYISCINVRLAHQILGCADAVMPFIRKKEKICHTLLISPPGCGKTTLLKTLGLIHRPTSGSVWLEGEDTGKLPEEKRADIRNRKIGFIFQDFYLMNSLSVEENIMLPMMIAKSEPEEMRKRAATYATQFEIAHLLKKYPYELSGGERQRVAICRALMNEPELILADEPTGNLDSRSGQIVIDALGKISKELGKTILMVTHDPKMASCCGRILLLKDGVILKELKAEEDKDAFYREITGQMECL